MRYKTGEITLSADVQGSGPALLMVHGFPLDRSIWQHQVATLTGWRRIAPDLRGMGDSDAPAEGYSMSAYADDLVRLLDRLDVDRAVVAGLSMGGYVAFELLRRHGSRVAGLILCDTKAAADTAEGKKGRDEMIALAGKSGAAAVAERMLPKLLGRSTHQSQPGVVAQVRDMIVRSPVAGIVGALQAMRDRPDSTPLLSGIRLPTLVIAGEEDELIPPAVSREMAALVPSASVAVIPNAGHVPCLEAPAAVTRVVADFLETVRL